MSKGKPRRWYSESWRSAREAGIEPGDRLPPITGIEGPDGRSAATAHDLFEFDGETATLLASAWDLRDAASEAAAEIRRAGADAAVAAKIEALLARIDRGDVEGKAHAGMNAIHAAMPPRSEIDWEIDVPRDALIISRISIHPDHRGAGNAVARSILRLADELALAIEVVADPTDRPGDPDGPALERWYRRLGFARTGEDESTGSPTMRREPRPA